MKAPVHVLVVAGGLGRRLNPRLPKALSPVLFRPMIHHALELAATVRPESLCVLLGAGEQEVKGQCRDYKEVFYLRQGGIVPFFRQKEGDVAVLRADSILARPGSLAGLLRVHARGRAGCSVSGPGLLCFKKRALLRVAKEEDFLLAAGKFAARKAEVRKFPFADPLEGLIIEDFETLAKAELALRDRVNRELMRNGVRLQDPGSTIIDPRCRISAEVQIEGGCLLVSSVLGPGVKLESGSRVCDSEVGEGTLVKQGSYIEKSQIGRDCLIGPYAHVRPGSHIGDRVRIGNFVEVKNSFIGAGSKAAHLSYLGDAQVGADVNIGCGFITCNYDGGPVKQRTVIEDGVFVGSDSQAIAPVKLGARSYIASGTTITENVPPDSFAISRGRQITKIGYAAKYRRTRRWHVPSRVAVPEAAAGSRSRAAARP